MHHMLRIVGLTLVLIWGLVADASAQGTWTQDGITWHYYPQSSHMPGECAGHCGKGCTNSWNPCSIKGHWELDGYDWGPNFLGRTTTGSEEFQPQYEAWPYDGTVCSGYYYVYHYDEWETSGKWIYKGNYSNFCYKHDLQCWADPWACVFAFGAAQACYGNGGLSHKTYGPYYRYMRGETNGERVITSYGTGPC